MKMKIAIPTENGILCAHFGHCEAFYMVNVEGSSIENEMMIVPPAHEPGLYPKWIKEQGVDLVIGGGMGKKARDLFALNGVSLIVGAPQKNPKEIIEAYLNNTLEVEKNSCDH